MAETAPKYILPRDAPEDERLDFQHKLLCRLFGGLYVAPLPAASIHRVLDIGCGTGKWAIDYALQNPHATVIGIDISASPTWDDVPANCELRVANAEDGKVWEALVEEGGKFEFIHGRFIVVGIRDWPALFELCTGALASKGWFEIQDIQFPAGCEDTHDRSVAKFYDWGMRMTEAMVTFGLAPTVMNEFPGMMAQAGFGESVVSEYKLRASVYGDTEEEREIGRMGNRNFHMGFRGFSETLMKNAYGMTEGELAEQARVVLEELDEGKLRCYLPVKVCYAQLAS